MTTLFKVNVSALTYYFLSIQGFFVANVITSKWMDFQKLKYWLNESKKNALRKIKTKADY